MKKIISKEQYLDILEQQRVHLEKKVKAAKSDLFDLECAIEHQIDKDFDEVEVTEKLGAYTFTIVEKSND
ncbi:hypothetical protein [Vibrio hepatarius]|uniref:hypothetical protein n=1 Tax=Vibrio hepatarius TaxID=171383 RepID=UPI00148D80F3|nr:hypothetical protein [Vibrio hepatarius]NOI14801.1 hypothetical protein [Vibrio hepatarius]